MGPQAFRLGSALAVQFHPETTPDVAARWAADDRQQLESLGLDEDELARRSAAEATGAHAHGRRSSSTGSSPASPGAGLAEVRTIPVTGW